MRKFCLFVLPLLALSAPSMAQYGPYGGYGGYGGYPAPPPPPPPMSPPVASPISGLPAATTPLGGNEIVPVVQAGVTKKVLVSDLLDAGNLSGTLGVANGGTGLTGVPANGDLPIGNGTGYTLGTLTAGSGVSIVNGPGSITISASGGSSGAATDGSNATGTWPISISGTASGLSGPAADGQILIGNGTGYTLSTLTAGSGVSITNGAGSITISASGGSGGGCGGATGTCTVQILDATQSATIGTNGGTTSAGALTVYGGLAVNATGTSTSAPFTAIQASGGTQTFWVQTMGKISLVDQSTNTNPECVSTNGCTHGGGAFTWTLGGPEGAGTLMMSFADSGTSEAPAGTMNCVVNLSLASTHAPVPVAVVYNTSTHMDDVYTGAALTSGAVYDGSYVCGG